MTATLHARIEELEEEVRQLRNLRFGPHEGQPIPTRINFTYREIQLLTTLVTNCDRVLSREFIYSALYRFSDNMPEEKIIDVFINKLRKKLKPWGVTIETVWGVGYKLPKASLTRLQELSAEEQA